VKTIDERGEGCMSGTRGWPIVYGRDDLTCPVPPQRIARMIRHAKERPWRGDTSVTDRRHILDTTAITEPGRLTRCLFTLDYGYHASGWFANSDFDRCWHLSVSHPTNIPEVKRMPLQLGGGQHVGYRVEAPTDEEVAAWGRVFWQDRAPLALYEPPVGPLDPYRSPGVGHLRVWLDAEGRAHKPTGEVYHLRPFPDGSSPAKVTEGRLGGDVR
jgi:hypothetical protein